MMSATFDSVFHALALLAHTLMPFGGSSCGINYHTIEIKSASICVSKICMTTENVWDISCSASSQVIHDDRITTRVVAHLDARVATKCDLHTYITNKIIRDNDIHLYSRNIKETEIVSSIIKWIVLFNVFLVIIR